MDISETVQKLYSHFSKNSAFHQARSVLAFSRELAAAVPVETADGQAQILKL